MSESRFRRHQNVKFSHTRYQVFGLELIPVYSSQVTISHPPSGTLPLLSTRSTDTFPAKECHRPSDGTKKHMRVSRLLEAVTWKWTSRDSNLRRFALQENAPQLCHTGHLTLISPVILALVRWNNSVTSWLAGLALW